MTVKKIFRNIDRDNRLNADNKKSAQKSVSYGISGVDDNIEECATMNSTSVKALSGDVIYNVGAENVHAVVVGCNSLHDGSSARTVDAAMLWAMAVTLTLGVSLSRRGKLARTLKVELQESLEEPVRHVLQERTLQRR